MLSKRDCLDYCDLTDDEIALFAQYEHLSEHVAVTVACGLIQTDEGVSRMDHALAEQVNDAMRDAMSNTMNDALDPEKLGKVEHVLHVYVQFRAAHPLAH
ncbi:MAG TPA: hypothetical protein VFW00_04080 [Rhodocyclaceae bacterium]|nr:hypothetical protein [Rhodocyclaceae bacterium]